jgi:pilus assembly protein FimV
MVFSFPRFGDLLQDGGNHRYDWDVSRMNQKPISHPRPEGQISQWLLPVKKASLISLAVASCWITPAQALTMGGIRVSSALGEPLKAEIELSQISEDDLSNLTAAVANPDAYKTAGMEYSAALSSVVISVQKLSEGKALLSLRSDRAVNDPFMDMIVEVNWATGRIVRDYTLLLDPRVGGAPVQLTPAQTAPILDGSKSASDRTPAQTTRSQAPSATGTVTVKPGDTAGKIAAEHMGSGASLEQMLASMLRSNPDAFIGGDINRIKAGAIIQTPDAQAASQISPSEARQTLVASSKNFGEYRQRAALATPRTAPKAERESSGQIQARVEDKAPVSTSADKLKLSQPKVKGTTTVADAVAKSKVASESQARTAELNKNITDLTKVSAAASSVASAATASKAGIAVTAPVALAAASVAASAPAPVASLAASAAVAAASAPASAASVAAAPAKPKPKAPPPPPPEPSLMDQITSEPAYAAGAVGLVALLLGGLFFWRKRKNAEANVDSSFLASRLQPDSFFSGSGGQQVNTSEVDPNTGSSMMYSPSQLDAGGDVDPVAEAEVYIAYGRDLQAEEILKEALRTNNKRTAVHVKLLEIYAKRRDAKAFDLVAREVYDLTDGKGADWEKVSRIGRELSPQESMYQPGGKPSLPKPKAVVDSSVGGSSFADSTEPPMTKTSVGIPLDLNLDAVSQAKMAPAQPVPFEPTVMLASSVREAAIAPASSAAKPEEKPKTPGALDNSLSFDLDSISLDLKPADKSPALPVSAAKAEISPTDPMETKLQLASEFHALGDLESARALAQEVVSQAEGDTKAKAERLLSQWA